MTAALSRPDLINIEQLKMAFKQFSQNPGSEVSCIKINLLQWTSRTFSYSFKNPWKGSLMMIKSKYMLVVLTVILVFSLAAGVSGTDQLNKDAGVEDNAPPPRPWPLNC